MFQSTWPTFALEYPKSSQISFAPYIEQSPGLGAKSFVGILSVSNSIMLTFKEYMFVTILMLINHQNPINTTMGPRSFNFRGGVGAWRTWTAHRKMGYDGEKSRGNEREENDKDNGLKKNVSTYTCAYM